MKRTHKSTIKYRILVNTECTSSWCTNNKSDTNYTSFMHTYMLVHRLRDLFQRWKRSLTKKRKRNMPGEEILHFISGDQNSVRQNQIFNILKFNDWSHHLTQPRIWAFIKHQNQGNQSNNSCQLRGVRNFKREWWLLEQPICPERLRRRTQGYPSTATYISFWRSGTDSIDAISPTQHNGDHITKLILYQKSTKGKLTSERDRERRKEWN